MKGSKWRKVLNSWILILFLVILGLGSYLTVFYARQRDVQEPEDTLPEQAMDSGNTVQPDNLETSVSSVAEEPKTVEETPKPVFSDKQKEILTHIRDACMQEDCDQAGTALKEWKELRDSEEDAGADFTGYFFDGEEIGREASGTDLASDGETRFYYGELRDGVPDGEGIRLVLSEYHRDTVHDSGSFTFLWIKGRWENGIVTGDAEVQIVQKPVNAESAVSEYRRTVFSCTFDGSKDEIMSAASVNDWIHLVEDFADEDQATRYYQFDFEYQIVNGKLVTENWTWEEDENIWELESLEQSEGMYGVLGVREPEKSCYQNPYPWQGEYRFAYEEMFLEAPTLYGSRSFRK